MSDSNGVLEQSRQEGVRPPAGRVSSASMMHSGTAAS